jgi:FlaG/FlaF family flagellin (archaellin)
MTDPDRVPERERETTIVHTDNGGGGGGTVIAVILLIAVLALLFYLFGGQLLGSKKTDVNVHVDTPVAGKSG